MGAEAGKNTSKVVLLFSRSGIAEGRSHYCCWRWHGALEWPHNIIACSSQEDPKMIVINTLDFRSLAS